MSFWLTLGGIAFLLGLVYLYVSPLTEEEEWDRGWDHYPEDYPHDCSEMFEAGWWSHARADYSKARERLSK
jgi:hypothetical protein